VTAVAARPVRARPAEAPHRPSLRLVATRPLVAGRLPFALLIGGILSVGLIVLLLLHTLAAQDAFRLQKLERAASELSDTRQQLALTEQQRQAPATLAAQARALGMVPTGSIAFVRLHRHHRIVGVVRAAAAPLPAPVTSATPTHSPAATASHQPAHKVSATHRRGSPRPHG
jgi:HAMP domain-containing protein